MNFIHRLSIRWILISGIVLAVAVVIASVTSVIMNRGKQRLQEHSVEVASKLVHAHITDFVRLIAFNTPDIAADTVSRLESFPEIKDVLLYDSNATLAFSYHNTDTPSVARPHPDATAAGVLRDGFVHVLHDVTYQDYRYGRVYLRTSAEEFEQRVQSMRALFATLVPSLIGFSIILAIAIERIFSGPLLRLTDAFRRISETQNYSLRVPVRERNEFQVLNAGFNQMLGRIENANRDLHEQKERLQVTLQSIADGVLTLRPDGTVEFLNPAAERLLGISAAHADGVAIKDLVSIADAGSGRCCGNPALTAIETRRPTQVCAYRATMKRTDHVRLVETSAAPLLDAHGQVTGAVLVLHDITESRQAEEQARQALQEKVAADAANQAKSTFLAHMSHEIRTPMTAVLGFAETLLEPNQSAEQRRNAVQRILRSGNHLLQIINDILDLSKIEAGKLEIEQIACSPFQILADVESLVGSKAHEKGLEFNIHFDSEIPTQIISDPVRLKQVLINLCSNAVKFTDRGRISVYVQCDRAGERLEFDVVDTGVGLSEDQAAKLFRPFTQADSSITRKYGGTGLGLSLSKRLAAMLGGELQLVRSAPGDGSRFRLTVATGGLAGIAFERDGARQLRQAYRQESTACATAFEPVAGRILVAEDTPELQELLRHYLRKSGAQVEIVGNGKEAVDRALRQPADLILMDMQMPVMGGIEATTQLRAVGYEGPIVALTANAMQEDVQRALAAGCNAVVTKPIDWQRLCQVVMEHLPRAAAVSALPPPMVSQLLGDEPELRDLIVKFIGDLPRRVDGLSELIESEDWPLAKKELHNLKGMSGNLGYPVLSELAGKIEAQLRRGELHDIRASLAELREASSRVTAGLSLLKVEAD